MSIETFSTPMFWMPRPGLPTIYLAMPLGSRNVDIGASEAWQSFPTYYPKEFNVLHAKAMGGITHDELWLDALNRKMPFFAMIHSDIEPETWWLDYLWTIRKETNADLVCVSIAMKDKTQLSSIGICKNFHSDNPVIRKIKLLDIEKLPEPFTADDLDRSGQSRLCFNTGLWLADMTKPWAQEAEWWGDSSRRKLDDGRLISIFTSEDYKVSLMLAKRSDVKIVGSHKLDVKHHGHHAYTNKPLRDGCL